VPPASAAPPAIIAVRDLVLEVDVGGALAQFVRDVDLAELCITSAGTVRPGAIPSGAFTLPDVPDIGVRVSPAPGERCERCWRVLPEVGQAPDHADLCCRCAEIVGSSNAPVRAASPG